MHAARRFEFGGLQSLWRWCNGRWDEQADYIGQKRREGRLNRKLTIIDYDSLEPFESIWTLQQTLVSELAEERQLPDKLILLEHLPIYTVGRNTPFSDTTEC